MLCCVTGRSGRVGGAMPRKGPVLVRFLTGIAMNSHDEGCLAQLPRFHHCRVDEVADLLGSSLLRGT